MVKESHLLDGKLEYYLDGNCTSESNVCIDSVRSDLLKLNRAEFTGVYETFR